jgi:hypothetical protein
MEDGSRLQPHTRAWLKQSALEAHVSGYCAYLASRGYAPSTRRVYLCCVAHFARWMRREKLALKRLDEEAVASYLTGHLQRCDCQEPVRRMVALSTYVGHAKVSDTYWYLTAAPDLMSVAGRRFEQFVKAGDA